MYLGITGFKKNGRKRDGNKGIIKGLRNTLFK
jgi:hypothetical protein